jgi:hypothetical protein
MKNRTRVAAWILTVFWSIVSAISLVLGVVMFSYQNSEAGMYAVVLFIILGIGIPFLLGWIMLLRKKIWAWWVLVLLHIPVILYLILGSIGGMSIISVFLLASILTLVALLTDPPKAWNHEKVDIPPADSQDLP